MKQSASLARSFFASASRACGRKAVTLCVNSDAKICHLARLFFRKLLILCPLPNGRPLANTLRMKNKDGFSLLELLIVVAIILIIATIAIPSLLRSRQAANESHAVANLRTLNTAEVQYISSHQGSYGGLPELVTAGMLDSRYTAGSAGYNFAIDISATYLDYTAVATAQGPNMGRFDYWTRPDYVIRYSTDPTRAPGGRAGQPVQ
jgi:prepilin-type N-terminal cleavage/methylation domain-containing protein